MRSIITRGLTALFVVVCLLGLAPVANAQFLEALLYGAVSSGINTQIAKGQERVFSAVKVVFDIYLIRGDMAIYLNSWDPTTQTSVWFGDQIALKVKPFSNSGPAHDHTVFANDRLIEWRRVEGGRVVRGKPSGAQGVVGDYPFVYVKDLDMGFNQIKVRLSKTEWGSATFIRLDIQQFMQLAQDEQARLAIAGAGGSTYPALQSYTALISGKVQNFTSLEEYQATMNGGPKGQVSKDELRVRRQESDIKTEQQPQQPKQSRAIEVFATPYGQEIQEFAKREGVEKAHLELANMALGAGIWASDELAIVEGQGLAILIISKQKMTVELRGGNGKPVVVKTETADGPLWSCLVPLVIKSGGQPTTQLVIRTDTDKRELRFRKEKK